MRLPIIVLVVSSLAWADGPDGGVADAPRMFDEHDVRKVKSGDLVPYDGLLYSEKAAVATEGALRKAETDRDNAQADLAARGSPTSIYIAAAILVVGAFAGGYAIGAAMQHH